MDVFFLDAGGEGLLLSLGTVFLVITFLIESICLFIIRFARASQIILATLLANLVTLLLGYVFVFLIPGMFELEAPSWYNFLFIYLITVILEFPVFMLIIRNKTRAKLLITISLINLLSYLILFVLSWV